MSEIARLLLAEPHPGADVEPNLMTAGEMAGGFENAWLVFDTYLNGVAEKVTEEG